MRVCRHGGRIGLANWTPAGFVGEAFKVVASHVPPPSGLLAPSLWGTEARLVDLLGAEAHEIHSRQLHFTFRYRSASHWLEGFRTWYGPFHRAFATLGPAGQAALEAELTALVERFNVSRSRTMVVPAAYLETVVVA
ncbi:MAG TPA: hypothetical protein VMK12_00295 [Anaeromyxobacteraceae bacterium]|nr:hypothetical protein [Anaeromyxobacteraceae bacterium]